MLRFSKNLAARMYKRGMGPQNAYNDQPQFINRTVHSDFRRGNSHMAKIAKNADFRQKLAIFGP